MLNAALLLLGVLSTDADSVMKRGKAVPAGPAVTVGAILADPAKYSADNSLVIDGMVIKSCTSMGCWMQLGDSLDAKGLKVEFNDHSFVIPIGAAGMKARAIGQVTVKPVAAADVEGRMGEGAAIVQNDKGESVEVAMQATGVELYYVD